MKEDIQYHGDKNSLTMQKIHIQYYEAHDKQQKLDGDDLDMDSLMASLKQHAQQKDKILAEEQQEHEKQQHQQEVEVSHIGTTTKASSSSIDDSYFETLGGGGGGGGDNYDDKGLDSSSFEREGMAKSRVSPRDLRLAAGNGEENKVKEYLDLHPEYVNRQDKNGWAPLHLAARAGDISIASLLLEHEADMHLTTTDGQYAYQIAGNVHGRESKIIEILRPEGMIDADDVRHAVRARSVKLLREYSERRPDLLDSQDQNGWSALHEAARIGNESLLRVLLEFGSDMTLSNKHGEIPFHIAAAHFGRDHEVADMLRPDGYIDDVDLRLAAGKGDVNKVKEYLDAGLNIVNQQDDNGWAAIHEAARSGAVLVLQELINSGGDKELVTYRDESAYQIAVKFHGIDHEVARLLRPAGVTIDDEARIAQEEEKRRLELEESQRQIEKARMERELDRRRRDRKLRSQRKQREASPKEEEEEEQQMTQDVEKRNPNMGSGSDEL